MHRARAGSSVDRALPSGGRSRGFESLPARLGPRHAARHRLRHAPPAREPRLPAACLERLAAADAILHAGDLMELEVLERSRRSARRCTRSAATSTPRSCRRGCRSCGRSRPAGARIAMIHDAGPADGRLAGMRRRFPDADAVVFGHSHLPLHEERDGFAIFNPGSPTERRRAPHHTMGSRPSATAGSGSSSFPSAPRLSAPWTCRSSSPAPRARCRRRAAGCPRSLLRAGRRPPPVRLRRGHPAAAAALGRAARPRRDLRHPLPPRPLARAARDAQDVRPARAREAAGDLRPARA